MNENIQLVISDPFTLPLYETRKECVVMKRMLLTWFAVATLALSLRAQDFTNMDFENAKIAVVTGAYVDASNALPGWSVLLGTNELATVLYNDFSSPFPRLLVGSNSWVIGGNFSVAFGGNYSISQTGLVPGDAESLLFDATLPSLLLSLDGVDLSYLAISNAVNSSGLNYTTYGADISSFAGQVETLTFSEPYGASESILDDIRFSPEAVPEPSAASLVFLGGGALFYLRRKSRRRFGGN